MTKTICLEEMLLKLVDMRTDAAPILANIEALRASSIFANITALELEIKQYVKETGEVGSVDGATVAIRNGYTRHSWNNKALEGFAISNPDILQFRVSKDVEPSVILKVTL